MTIKETQELIEAWTGKVPARQCSAQQRACALAEHAGQLARNTVLCGEDPSPLSGASRAALQDELGDAMWDLFALANRLGIDLTQALIGNLEKKNNQPQ